MVANCMNSGRMWKEGVLANWKILSQHLPANRGKNINLSEYSSSVDPV